MSNMSYLEKLLDGVDVEWKTLGEVGKFIRGNGIQKKDFVETGFPAVHYGQIFTKYGLYAYKTFTFISDDLVKKSRIAKKNDERSLASDDHCFCSNSLRLYNYARFFVSTRPTHL